MVPMQPYRRINSAQQSFIHMAGKEEDYAQVTWLVFLLVPPYPCGFVLGLSLFPQVPILHVSQAPLDS